SQIVSKLQLQVDNQEAGTHTFKAILDKDGNATGTYTLEEDSSGDRYAVNINATNGEVNIKTIDFIDADGTETTAQVKLGGFDGTTEFVEVDGKTYLASDLANKSLATTAYKVREASFTETDNPLKAIDDALAKVDSLRSEL